MKFKGREVTGIVVEFESPGAYIKDAGGYIASARWADTNRKLSEKDLEELEEKHWHRIEEAHNEKGEK